MRLAEYLSENNLTHERFAEIVGVSRPTVTHWLRGGRIPEFQHLQRVIEVTSGAVTANDFINLPEDREAGE